MWILRILHNRNEREFSEDVYLPSSTEVEALQKAIRLVAEHPLRDGDEILVSHSLFWPPRDNPGEPDKPTINRILDRR
jgi:hypothetical protein